jgi:hypothetical protein
MQLRRLKQFQVLVAKAVSRFTPAGETGLIFAGIS